jgi:DDE_Tnp_1-associated
MLDEMLLLCLVGVLAGCERWVELARFGEKKLSLLRRFRLFNGGTPSEGQLRDIFAAIDPEQFQRLFRSCFSSLTGFSTNKIREGWCKGPYSHRSSIELAAETCICIGSNQI